MLQSAVGTYLVNYLLKCVCFYLVDAKSWTGFWLPIVVSVFSLAHIINHKNLLVVAWIIGMRWLLSGWNEAQSTLWTFGLHVTLDIANPDTCQCLKLPFEPLTSPWIHPCYNHHWVSRQSLCWKLIVQWWLYAGEVSLILSDVRFGMVSLDWVTNIQHINTNIQKKIQSRLMQIKMVAMFSSECTI